MDKIQEQQIIEGNKLIAEFMGYYCLNEYARHEQHGSVVNYSEMEYRTSWGWLMPVVEKIESEQGCIIEMWLSLGKGCRINRLQPKGSTPITIPFIAESNSLIECVYSAVIQFITWYTTTQTKNK